MLVVAFVLSVVFFLTYIVIQEIHIFGLERDREFYLRVLEGRFEDEELWREEVGE